MKKCKLCGYELYQYSSKYYCCDKQELFCSFCNSKKCPKCLKSRLTLLRSPQCGKCYSRVNEQKGFQDKKCGKYFCSRCLVKPFKPVYQNSCNIDSIALNERNNQVLLFCGHQSSFKDLKEYFKNFCVECGKQYREKIDYQLKDGVKLCYSCYCSFKDKYEENFIYCVGCGKQIDNNSKAGIANSQGLILCQLCVHQSEIQEVQLEKSRVFNQRKKLQESKYEENQFQKTQQITNTKVSQVQKVLQIQQKSQEKASSAIKQNESSLKKQSLKIDEIKQKASSQQHSNISQKFDFKNLNNQDYAVIDSIVDEMQEGNEEMRRSLGLQKKLLLKKHLSGETRVQKLLLQIEPNKKEEFVSCQQCKSRIPSKIAYNLKAISSSKIKAPILHSISEQELFHLDKNQKKIVCRVCYLKVLNDKKKQKKDLGFSRKINQEKSFFIEDRKQKNFSKVESSIKTTNKSLYGSSLQKGYGLTGPKPQAAKGNQRNQSVQKQKKYSDDYKLLKKDSQSLRASSNYLTKQRVQNKSIKRCIMCGSTNKKLTFSATMNPYCMDCLSIYRPLNQTRASKLIF